MSDNIVNLSVITGVKASEERYQHVVDFIENDLCDWSTKDQELLLRTMIADVLIVNPDEKDCVVKAYKPVLSRMDMNAEPDNNGKHLCEITACSTVPDEANDGQLVIFAQAVDLTSSAVE